MKRKNLSQNKLAEYARLNQPLLNKMINGRIYDMKIDTLVCVCLALQLSLDESIDLLARAERAFSPASELHRAYQYLIENNIGLDDADEYLKSRKLPMLPNIYSY